MLKFGNSEFQQKTKNIIKKESNFLPFVFSYIDKQKKNIIRFYLTVKRLLGNKSIFLYLKVCFLSRFSFYAIRNTFHFKIIYLCKINKAL